MHFFILLYVQDILILSRSSKEHWGHLRQMLTRHREADIYDRLHKSEFFKYRVDYFGFEVWKEGMQVSPDKLKAVVEWPQSAHEVRAFLGLVY